jgi:predicted TIM-barrel fold metal-dependent hydrolase
VLAAEIDEPAKRAILRGNAERLFGLPHRAFDIPAPTLPSGAVDVHAHYNPSPWNIPQLTAAELAPAFARLGIAANVASSALGILHDNEAGNEQAAAAASPATGQYTYLAADPWDLDRTRSMLRRWGTTEGVVGVKVHAQQFGMNTRDPRMADLFDILADHGRPVKIHNEGDGWDEALLAIGRRHPRLPIIVAHSGLGAPSLEAARIAAASDNIHIEMASSFASRSMVREVVRTTPRERILFGTDAPLLNPAYIMGTYLDGGIEADETRVFSGRARELFGI